MKKKKKPEEHENLERWLISYADFITLLFAFFTTLYALSLTDKAKKQAAMEAIEAAFMSAGGIFPLKGSPFTPFDKPPKGSEVPPSPKKGKQSKSETDAIARIAYQTRNLFEDTTGLNMKGGELEVLPTDEGFKIRLGEQVLFSPGSDKLKMEYVPFLNEVGKKLAKLGLQVHIEGHTDNSPPGTGQSNWQLSLSRSYHLSRFLVEACNYPQDKISMAGYGDTHPVADNDTPEGRTKNRRVEISVSTNKQDIAELPW